MTERWARREDSMSWREMNDKVWEMISNDVDNHPEGFYGDKLFKQFQDAIDSFLKFIGSQILPDPEDLDAHYITPGFDLDAAFTTWKRDIWPKEKPVEDPDEWYPGKASWVV